MERDCQVNAELESEGWLVLRFWEWQIKRHLDDCVKAVLSAVNKRKSCEKSMVELEETND